MSQFLHYQFDLTHGDAVRVKLSGCESDVFLVDSSNFNAFKSGRSFRYTGGHYRQSPIDLAPPHPGRWHVVVKPTGGQVRASASVIQF